MTRSAHFLFALSYLVLATVAPIAAQQPGVESSASIPHLIRFSGLLKSGDGSPAQGTVGVIFAFYKDEQGGTPLWMETQNVKPDASGRYSVMLGSTKSEGLPAELFISNEARWLSVDPQGLPAPARVLLLSVPYALKAADAETIGGLPPSAFMLAAPASAAVPSVTSSATSAPPPATSVTTSGGTVNTVPLWSTSTDIENSAITQTGSGATAKVGINTNAPASTLDVKGGATVRGTLSLPSTAVATAASGKNSQPANLAASSFNSTSSVPVAETFQIKAESSANNTANPSGTLNVLFGSGTSAPTETGLKIASNGQITFANGQTFPGTGKGTITGVAAGTGLTGGGTSGSVTLSIDTVKVPLLNAANTFTASQTINANLSAAQLLSTAAQGTAPLQVTSSTQVPNLNATFLAGFSASSFQLAGSYATLGSNSFTGNQSVTGNVTASGTVSGASVNATSSFNLGGNPFAFGSQNTADSFFGFAGNQSMTGTDNVGVGGGALLKNSSGNSNVAAGTTALNLNTTGSNNTAAGSTALASNTTGSNNTALGANAGPDSGHSNLSNSTALGANAVVSENNALVLGGTGANAVNVGIGTPTPASTLDVHGTGNFTGLITFASGQTFPGTGTITGVVAGTDLLGGGSSGSVSLGVDTSKVMTGITAGTGLTGGGTGGVQTLSIDTSRVPQLSTANTFTGNQTVNGNLTATGYVTGTGFQIGSNLFGFGNYSSLNSFSGFAGNLTTTGVNLAGVGVQALLKNTSGYNNTATGTGALLNNTTGFLNTANGTSALQGNTTGAFNTAIGEEALFANSSGVNNSALGYATLFYNSIGVNNTAIGYGASYSNSSGNGNTATGSLALASNQTGSNNTALGFQTLSNGGSASDNTAIGYNSMEQITSGGLNTAVGESSLFSNSTGGNNSAIGWQALYSNTTGSRNAADGEDALFFNTTGSFNTGLGYAAGPPAVHPDLTNATAVGARAEVDASNSLVLGSINGINGATADTNVGIALTVPLARLHIGQANAIGLRVEGPATAGTGYDSGSFGGYGAFSIDSFGAPGGRFTVQENGFVGVGTNFPDSTLTVNGTADKLGGGSWGTYSDRRLKDVGTRFDSGLSQVLRIDPIHYRYKAENGMDIHDREDHVGVVAQEIKKVIPEAVTENSKGYLIVNNDPIIWAMLNAIKQQQQQIREQRRQIHLQQSQISRLSGKVGVLESALRTTKASPKVPQQRTRTIALKPDVAATSAQ